MISIEKKNQIVDAAIERRKNSGITSDSKFAVTLGISASQYSRIVKREYDGVLSDANWIHVARKLGVELSSSPKWVTASTPAYQYIAAQLQYCQELSTGGIFCDKAAIGKTYTARCYIREHKHAIYIDCSQVKSKRMLLKQIAKEFGITPIGLYREIYEDLVYYLRSIEKPLVILDEAGDLSYEAFLELKALYNATDGFCGWYMMGADGLRKKFEKNRERYKVGYQEIFSRYGSRYNKVTPDGKEASRTFEQQQAILIAKANGADEDLLVLIRKATDIDLRRIYIEINKRNRAA
ncbi:MAG TPA: ATP-binding protein [Bacteroidales bacterium]|nr:ATP-binding protein [Bacteroidales bacterium]